MERGYPGFDGYSNVVDRLLVFRMPCQSVFVFFVPVSSIMWMSDLFQSYICDRPTIIAGLGYTGPAAQLHTGKPNYSRHSKHA